MPSSNTGVVAGLVPATPNIKARSKNNRGGRDKPGHDPGEMAVASTSPEAALTRLVEPNHPYRQRVTPGADIEGAPGQTVTAEFHIGKSIMIRLLGAVRNEPGWVSTRSVGRMMVWNFENRDEEFAVVNHEVREPFQADAEKVKRQCRKYRLRQSEIDPHRAPRKIEFSLGHEIGPGQFVRQPCLREFDLVSGVEQRLVQIDTGIMTGVKISYQFHPAPKAAATDV